MTGQAARRGDRPSGWRKGLAPGWDILSHHCPSPVSRLTPCPRPPTTHVGASELQGTRQGSRLDGPRTFPGLAVPFAIRAECPGVRGALGDSVGSES